MRPVELWKQYVWNPVVNYAYWVYFYFSGESWLEEEENQKRSQRR